MKKGISLLAVLTMLVFATGCTNPFQSATDTDEGITVNDEVVTDIVEDAAAIVDEIVETNEATEEVVEDGDVVVKDTLEEGNGEEVTEAADDDTKVAKEEMLPESDDSNE